LVARLVWDQDVAGSNPAAPTNLIPRKQLMKKLCIIFFILLLLCTQACVTGSAMLYNESIEWFKIGKSSLDAGVYQEAIAAFDNAIEYNPQYADAYYYRGLAYGFMGNDDQSIVDMKVAARLDFKTAQDYLRKKRVAW
jgi:tetratricopeptide (TPR) repeat protein